MTSRAACVTGKSPLTARSPRYNEKTKEDRSSSDEEEAEEDQEKVNYG